ncbi:hypothetical protein, partial [Microcystis sp. M090S1]|uniref:hypothetical protein n=1 Tax=Microcystis sp. M090S1 TaxID=2771135 RepID=UPI00258BA501
LRNVTNYMGTLRKVKGLHPLMDKGFGLLWYICMGEVQIYLGFSDFGLLEVNPKRGLELRLFSICFLSKSH